MANTEEQCSLDDLIKVLTSLRFDSIQALTRLWD